jgi:hypothetical protein
MDTTDPTTHTVVGDALAAHNAAEAAAHHRKTSPRGDFVAALVWIALGIATAIGSWRMDRLEKQDVNPYTVPGLLPGFLGLAIILFGGLMLYRAWRQGALEARPARIRSAADRAETRRLWTVLALCLGFGAGLVGHGLPFWAAAAVFIAVTITILQYAERGVQAQRARGLLVALSTGLIAGLLITLVFQEFFLVRLP